MGPRSGVLVLVLVLVLIQVLVRVLVSILVLVLALANGGGVAVPPPQAYSTQATDSGKNRMPSERVCAEQQHVCGAVAGPAWDPQRIGFVALGAEA